MEFSQLMEYARHGDVNAQIAVGICYDTGHNVARNYKLAIEWYTKGADQGDPEGQYLLALMYFEGKGVEQDDEKAFQLFLKAAENGHGVAQYNVATFYKWGKVVEQSDILAARWYSKSASQGDSDAQYDLAMMYHSGKGVEQDYEKAFPLFLKAAANNHVDAQCFVGLYYYCGYGVEKNYTEAKEWFSKAAEGGHENAQELLENLEEYVKLEARKDVLEDDLRSPTAIEWTFYEGGIKGNPFLKYQYSAGNITVEAGDVAVALGGKVFVYWRSASENSLREADEETRGRFKNMKELSDFLVSYHDDLFYVESEAELVKLIQKLCGVKARKTVRF